ncbi:MAG: NERD domain-containing protein [Bacilli bacterium]|nr:NERD domain-containing protein [Bacilli bacterium]
MKENKIYKQLTNVDIETQKQLWNDRGKGYYGEYLVFCELYKHLSGMGKILMNINIPIENNKTTEIDLLLIHETGIYVFETKHYKGTIYGRDTDAFWTQFFRTTKNAHFKNPILQNRYHINALRKMFPTPPIYSIIVFTNDDCVVKATFDTRINDVCTLNDLPRILRNRFNNKQYFLPEQIDYIFSTLSQYSPMQEPVLIDTEEKDFLTWIQPTINNLKIKKQELETEKQTLKILEKEYNRNKFICTIGTVLFAILCLVTLYTLTTANKNNYEKELNKFKQNFQHVDEIDDEYIKSSEYYIKVSNQKLNNLENNTVSFQATLSANTDEYGIVLKENTKYIVMTTSGKAYEYDMFGAHLNYNRSNNTIFKKTKASGELKQIIFKDINVDEITYIKITNVELFISNPYYEKTKDDFEIELYKK